MDSSVKQGAIATHHQRLTALPVPPPIKTVLDPPTEAVRLCEIGKEYLLAGQYQQALEHFERVLDLQPHDVDGWCCRAEALACLNHYEEALQSLEQAQALTRFASPPILVQKAVVLILLSRYSQALSCCTCALQQEPEYAQAWLFHGVVLHRMGHYREAYRSYERAMTLSHPQYARRARRSRRWRYPVRTQLSAG